MSIFAPLDMGAKLGAMRYRPEHGWQHNGGYL
jgi:hypothetical protein